MDEKRTPDTTLGELAQTLLDNPVINRALHSAIGARELASSAQTQAMKNLNVATAADLERLSRRLRSFSDRLEGVEDQLDRLGREIAALRKRRGEDKERDSESLDQARLDEQRLRLDEERLGLSE